MSSEPPLCDHPGVSEGTDVAGAHAIFQRPLPSYNVRCIEYLGDDDPKGLQAFWKGNEWPEKMVEFTGHVKKRTGSRLKILKLKERKTKQTDEKLMAVGIE